MGAGSYFCAALACAVFMLDACVAELDVTVPDDPSAESVIFAIERAQAISIEAHARNGGRFITAPPMVLRRGDKLVLLFYKETLAKLELDDGPLPLVSGAVSSRPIPFETGFEHTIGDETGSITAADFHRISGLDDRLRMLRLPFSGAESCAEAGGCLDSRSSDRFACNKPCTPPGAIPAPRAPAEVAPPAPPVLTPCSGDWSPVPGELDTCAPRPAPMLLDCPLGQAQLYGSDRCTPIGIPCPMGQFADNLPGDRPLLFVDPAAPAGGTGTEDSPFTTLADAMSLATPRTVIALAKGSYAEAVEMRAGVTLLGACTAETVLGAPPGIAANVHVAVPDAELHNLRLEGHYWAVEVAGAGSSVHLEGVVARNGAVAIYAHDGGRASTHEAAIEQEEGSAVVVASGAIGEFSAVAIAHVGGSGIVYTSSTAARRNRGFVHDAQISDLHVIPGGNPASGISIFFADVEVARARVESAALHGIVVDAVSTATISDAAIAGTGTPAEAGYGVCFGGGARVRGERIVVERAHQFGACVDGQSSVHLTDLIVRDTQSVNGVLGHGLTVTNGARLVLSRAVLERNRTAGIQMSLASSATISDTIIRDTKSGEHDQIGGGGIGVVSGSTLTADRLAFLRNIAIAAYVNRASAHFRDFLARDIALSDGETTVEGGLFADNRARVQLERGLIERATGAGVFVRHARTLLNASDLTVTDTASTADVGRSEMGVLIMQGRAHLERVRLERNRHTGMSVAYPTGSAELFEARISDSGASSSIDPTGALVAQFGASLLAEHVAIERSGEAAVQITGRYDDAQTGARTLTRATIRELSVQGALGAGILLTQSATLTLDRAELRDVVREGVHLEGECAASIRELVVDGVRAGEDRFAAAIYLRDHPGLELYDFRLANSEGYGIGDDLGPIFLIENLSINTGVIERNQIGVKIPDLLDAVPFLDRVLYRDNETTFERAR